MKADATCPPIRGGRFTNETAVDAHLSQHVAGVATPEHSCSWITSFPLRGVAATRFRISGCSAEHTTSSTPDNASEHCTSRRRSPSSERAHHVIETRLPRLVPKHVSVLLGDNAPNGLSVLGGVA